MKVGVTLSPRDYDVVPFDLDGVLCIDGEVFEFASGTTRVLRLNDDATASGTHVDGTGDAP